MYMSEIRVVSFGVAIANSSPEILAPTVTSLPSWRFMVKIYEI
jgi:hypothetical protein